MDVNLFLVKQTATNSIVATTPAPGDFQAMTLLCSSVDLLSYFSFYSNTNSRGLLL